MPKFVVAAALACVAWGAIAGCGNAVKLSPPGEFTTGSSEGGVCPTTTVDTLSKPFYELIVLDGSGSMSDAGKWAAAHDALVSYFSLLGANHDNATAVGLTIFSDAADPNHTQPETGGTFNYGTVDVPIAIVNTKQESSLQTRLTTSPYGYTPTLECLAGQYPLLDAFTPVAPLEPGGTKVLVLISDGVPNDPGTSRPAILSLVTQYKDKGIKTFSVGVGELNVTAYDPKFMAQIAINGGTPRAGCNPDEGMDVTKMCHFQITPSAQANFTQAFVDALNQIRGSIETCEYKVDPDAAPVDTTGATIVLRKSGQDTVLMADATNGYTLDGAQATQVVLHGTACDQTKADPNLAVKIILPCRDAGK